MIIIKQFLLSLFFICLSSPLTLISAKEIILPDMGATSSIGLSASMEDKIARSIINQLESSHGLVDDLEINEYLTNLGYSIVEKSDDGLQPFHFYLLNSPQINAFATPGGVVAVYTGLFLNSSTESELASVVAHEIAHVTQRHIARAFEEADRMSIPLTLGLIAAILLGAAGSVDAGMAAATGLQAFGTQSQIDFTRANEKEADRVGMQYLYKANFDPYGMAGFFKRLHSKSRYAGKNYPAFLQTHPVTVDRIAEATSRAKQYEKNGLTVRSEKDYLFMKGKLMVITSRDPDSIEQYYKKLVSKLSIEAKPIEYYIYAYALLESGKVMAAIDIFKTLLKNNPEQKIFISALSKSLLKSTQKKHHSQALELLNKTLLKQPLDKILSAQYADALIKNNQLDKAIKLITNYKQFYPNEPIFYQKLSRIYGKQNNLLKAHIAHAEYYYLKGQYRQAIIQIKIAKKYAKNDFYSSSRLDAKLIQIKQERRRYSLEDDDDDDDDDDDEKQKKQKGK